MLRLELLFRYECKFHFDIVAQYLFFYRHCELSTIFCTVKSYCACDFGIVTIRSHSQVFDGLFQGYTAQSEVSFSCCAIHACDGECSRWVVRYIKEVW